MQQRKLSKPTDQRKALLRNQVTDLLWYGKIETTYARAKEVSRIAEKILTLAVNSFLDTKKQTDVRTDSKGREVQVESVVDGPKKLAARRKIMAQLYQVHEVREQNESKIAFNERTKNIKHPLVEKIFNIYAVKYAQRNQEHNCSGGYTRVLKTGSRRGDACEGAIIELV